MCYVHQKIGDFMLQRSGKGTENKFIYVDNNYLGTSNYVMDYGMWQRGLVCENKSGLCGNIQSVYNTTKQ